MNEIEIIAPRGSMRLEAFPPFEKYENYIRLTDKWKSMSDEEKLGYYSRQRKRFLGRQCQAIKAFMKQHRYRRRNGQ